MSNLRIPTTELGARGRRTEFTGNWIAWAHGSMPQSKSVGPGHDVIEDVSSQRPSSFIWCLAAPESKRASTTQLCNAAVLFRWCADQKVA
jgi:hypothetical protein